MTNEEIITIERKQEVVTIERKGEFKPTEDPITGITKRPEANVFITLKVDAAGLYENPEDLEKHCDLYDSIHPDPVEKLVDLETDVRPGQWIDWEIINTSTDGDYDLELHSIAYAMEKSLKEKPNTNYFNRIRLRHEDLRNVYGQIIDDIKTETVYMYDIIFIILKRGDTPKIFRIDPRLKYQ